MSCGEDKLLYVLFPPDSQDTGTTLLQTFESDLKKMLTRWKTAMSLSIGVETMQELKLFC